MLRPPLPTHSKSYGDEAALPGRRRGRGAGLGQSVAALIGALNIGRVVLLGSVDRARRAVARRGPRRGLAPVAAGCSPTHADRASAGPVDNVVMLGAAALLMTRELGLVPTR